MGRWEHFTGAVGIIDGTLHKINRRAVEPQEQFFNGHRRHDAFSTQVIVDNSGNIVFVQAGFLGHMNDAGQFQRLLPRIGHGGQLFASLCVSAWRQGVRKPLPNSDSVEAE